jgi:hypothetical protein
VFVQASLLKSEHAMFVFVHTFAANPRLWDPEAELQELLQLR